MTTQPSPSPPFSEQRTTPRIGSGIFWLVLVLLVGGTVLRSALATRLDSFTQDEGYHILAGVSYAKRGDFRINPEHPPLVKLWVGALMSATGFHLSPFRVMNDKSDERDFAEEDVYEHNDPDSVQRRARIAMWSLNALLLIAFTLALRRTFDAVFALAVLTVLAIDPTVAAHLPLVLTDLPISLLSATAVVLAARAFCTWSACDLIATSVALGLALATKHSGPVFAVLLTAAGVVSAYLVPRSGPGDVRTRRIAKLALALLGSLAILWAFYLFRYTESPTSAEVFNRPLAEKIADLNSPLHRFILTTFTRAHLLPRAYIWGFADTIRAGIEGRAETRLFYGRIYFGKVPVYFFPGILAVKLPLGLIALVLIGLLLLAARRVPQEFRMSLLVVLGVMCGLFLVLAMGATYGGIRHALPVAALLYVFAGLAVWQAFGTRWRPLRVAVAMAGLGAAISALPIMRPYEYYNEIIGTRNAYLYFNDEGLDAEQRGKELFQYYFANVRPSGEIPFVYYNVPLHHMKAVGMDFMGNDLQRDAERMANPDLSGTIFIGRWYLSQKPYWDPAALRTATPVARYGNLFVYRGTFHLPGLLASDSYFAAASKMFAQKPDLAEAERLFRQSVQLDPGAYFVYIDLGNLALARGAREEALSEYRTALRYAPNETLSQPIEEQIRRITDHVSAVAPALRDPMME